MEFSFDVDLGVKYSRSKAIKFLNVAGDVIAGKAAENVNETLKGNSKGQLANSIYPDRVDEKNLKINIYANTVYAKIQHEGGDIIPKKAKALAIPFSAETKAIAIPEGKSIRNIFPDLYFRPHKTGKSLGGLYKKMGKGKDDVLMYLLIDKVHLKGKFYLKNAMLSETPKILQQMGVN